MTLSTRFSAWGAAKGPATCRGFSFVLIALVPGMQCLCSVFLFLLRGLPQILPHRAQGPLSAPPVASIPYSRFS